MKSGKRSASIIMVMLLACTMVFASSAGKEYETFRTGLEAGDAVKASESYDRFLKAKDKDLASLYKQLDKAMKKNNAELYYETLDEIRTLKGLGMTKEESNELLTLIVDTMDTEKGLEKAAWLYDVSPYYQPVLRFEYSLDRPGFRSSGSRSFGMKPGSEITLPSQEDIAVRTTDFGVLKGWGLAPEMVTYLPGETIKMPATDQTLYAVWESGVSFKDTVSGIDEYTGEVKAGDVVKLPAVPEVTGQYIFEGWWDPSTGEYIAPDETEYAVRGNGGSFEALYLGLEVTNPQTSPYTTIPSGTQVTMSFDVRNIGNEDIKGISVKISSPDPDVKFLSDTFSFRTIPSERVGRVSTSILYTGAEHGKALPVDVELTDAEGNVWHGSFSLTSK